MLNQTVFNFNSSPRLAPVVTAIKVSRYSLSQAERLQVSNNLTLSLLDKYLIFVFSVLEGMFSIGLSGSSYSIKRTEVRFLLRSVRKILFYEIIILSIYAAHRDKVVIYSFI